MRYKKLNNYAQISMEYIIILGFVMFVIIGVLGVALFYSGSVKDQIRITQVNNFAEKVVSTAETVYYYGEPSKSTISVYLPENVKNITIIDNELFISTQVSSGLERRAFSSNVPITGSISTASGIRKIVINVAGNQANINSI